MNSILIGKIVNVHGIKGQIKIYPYTDDIKKLSKIKEIYLDEALKSKIDVKSCSVLSNMLVASLSGVDTIEKAEAMRDKNIYIPKENLSTFPKDSYYIEDLIGMKVIDKEKNIVGILEYVFNTGANDVYEVEVENKKIYLPAIKQVIKKVDIEKKEMYVEIMEGLI